MVVETLALLCSWHPGHESEYNAINPGLLVSVGEQYGPVRPYIAAGAYLDSYSEPASLAGVGCDLGYNYGVGVTLAHVNGSHLDDYPVVPIPSIYYRDDDGFTVRLIGSHVMVALSVGFTFGGGR